MTVAEAIREYGDGNIRLVIRINNEDIPIDKLTEYQKSMSCDYITCNDKVRIAWVWHHYGG